MISLQAIIPRVVLPAAHLLHKGSITVVSLRDFLSQ